ncbi:anthranilate synthase alpha subunit [Ostreococcus tauri]|uniref:anthranilate synthase n=1 Tax=Ostreococcus tauri TaxID=70448 RepID=A0A1Y5ID60_OSTTA|nr:anthranilate synthase alpha subunit [Ostreococcus tauri]
MSATAAMAARETLRDAFGDAVRGGHNVVPVYRRIFDDQLTPILAYRLLVKEDDREAPSFLLESVVGGSQVGRFSFLGRRPVMEVTAKDYEVTTTHHGTGRSETTTETDPMEVMKRISAEWRACTMSGLPECFSGGWVGFTGYDTVRYQYKSKLDFGEAAPKDDRSLPDIHLGLYRDVVVFDNATKQLYAVHWVMTDEYANVDEAYHKGMDAVDALIDDLQPSKSPTLKQGFVNLQLDQRPSVPKDSTMTKDDFLGAVAQTKEHIKAGDIFQLVLSHRFQRQTHADPFEVYRALRVVNPSPYMIYYQGRDCILVASSPEILCRVNKERTVVNRPLAGTRMRGKTQEEDEALEADLLADQKECAEHVMLVDLGRNDVGRVSKAGTVKVEKLMEIERYSHVMHISSTVTGSLVDNLGPWDVLRAALPAGTVSGAPKVRAMQIIDDLEVTRRGPYGGGIGYVGFTGEMDMALALRTMVVPTRQAKDVNGSREWMIHLQAGAGIVADSNPESEYQETVNKAAALGRAIDLAESAFSAD